MALAMFLGGAVNLAWAQSKADEYRVKAAFLFHFTQLVDWPPDALGDEKAPLTLCTVGEDPFKGDLDGMVEGKRIGVRTFRVQHFKETQDIRSCQVIFIGAGERSHVPALLAELQDARVLTVGETDGFVKQGGMIGFFLENNKVRFEINLEAAERAKLKISSRLLLLAKNVVGNHG